MDALGEIRPDFGVLREGRAFIRVLQLGLAIMAFATVVSVKTGTQIRITCRDENNVTTHYQVQINYSYPFRLKKTGDVMLPFCKPESEQSLVSGLFTKNFSSSAQFFCMIGVMSFIMLVLLIPAYVLITPVFAKGSLPAKLDFIVTGVWTILWFISSAAWAGGISRLSKYVQPENLIEILGDECGPGMCRPIIAGDHSTLIVSALFGFVNMVAGVGSLWFLLKETDWHKEADAGTKSDPNNVYSTDPGYQTPEYTTDPTMEPAGGMQSSFDSPGMGNGSGDYYGQPTY